MGEEDAMVMKIVKELHGSQAENIKMATQLQFVTDMVEMMATDMALESKGNVAKNSIIDDYAVRVYEQQKQKKI